MIGYALTFPLTSLVVQVAGSSRLKSGWLRLLLCLLAATVMATLAGVRDFEVGGPDVLHYGNEVFDAAWASPSFGHLLEWTRATWMEGDDGYFFLNFLVSRFTSDPRWFYFWLSMLNSAAVLGAIMLSRRLGSAGLMWLTYLALFYIDTFNLLRQSPALALGLLGIALVARGRPIVGLAVGLTGVAFHSSAVAFVLPWVAFWSVARRDVLPRKVLVAVVLAAAVAVANIGHLFELWGAFTDGQFLGYLSADHTLGGGRALVRQDVLRIAAVVAGLIVAKTVYDRRGAGISTGPHDAAHASCAETARRDAVVLGLIVLLLVDLMLVPVRPMAFTIHRFMLFFGYAAVLGLPAVAATFPVRRHLADAVLAAVLGAETILRVVNTEPGRHGVDFTSLTLGGWFSRYGGVVGWLAALLLLVPAAVLGGFALTKNPAAADHPATRHER